MTALSPKAKKAMLFIQRYVATDEFARAPTLLEIANAVDVTSKSVAHRLVSELVLAGNLGRARDMKRGLVVLCPLPDDRFEEAAKAACKALQCVASPDNIERARQAIVSTLVESQAA